jgi:hypothetical protein
MAYKVIFNPLSGKFQFVTVVPTSSASDNFNIDGGSATTVYPADAFKIDFGAAS